MCLCTWMLVPWIMRIHIEIFIGFNWSPSFQCSRCACLAVWISFQMTTISNIYRLNKCDVRIYVMCALAKCQIMKWNGHVWGIRIHVREYIIYVCDWQIIIHTWFGPTFTNQAAPSTWILSMVLCELLHMCLHMAFIVIASKWGVFNNFAVVFQIHLSYRKIVNALKLANVFCTLSTNIKSNFEFRVKVASHNFPIYWVVVTSINADNNILRG